MNTLPSGVLTFLEKPMLATLGSTFSWLIYTGAMVLSGCNYSLPDSLSGVMLILVISDTPAIG